MLQWEHSAILWTFIKLPFVTKAFVLSIFEWPLKTGFTVYYESSTLLIVIALDYLISNPESLVKIIRFFFDANYCVNHGNQAALNEMPHFPMPYHQCLHI